MSLLLDIKIVFLTVKKVFSRSDIALGEAETHRLRPDAKIRDFDVERRDLVNENQRAVY